MFSRILVFQILVILEAWLSFLSPLLHENTKSLLRLFFPEFTVFYLVLLSNWHVSPGKKVLHRQGGTSLLFRILVPQVMNSPETLLITFFIFYPDFLVISHSRNTLILPITTFGIVPLLRGCLLSESLWLVLNKKI